MGSFVEVLYIVLREAITTSDTTLIEKLPSGVETLVTASAGCCSAISKISQSSLGGSGGARGLSLTSSLTLSGTLSVAIPPMILTSKFTPLKGEKEPEGEKEPLTDEDIFGDLIDVILKKAIPSKSLPGAVLFIVEYEGSTASAP